MPERRRSDGDELLDDGRKRREFLRFAWLFALFLFFLFAFKNELRDGVSEVVADAARRA